MASRLLHEIQSHCYFGFAAEEKFALKTAASLLGKIAYSDSTPKRPALHLALVTVEPILLNNLARKRQHEQYPLSRCIFSLSRKSQFDRISSILIRTPSLLHLLVSLIAGIQLCFGYSVSATILKTHGWQYDPSDNRIASKTDAGGLGPTRHNKLNQLLSHGSGPTRVAGTVNEPSTVKVNGEDAKIPNQTLFKVYL